MKQKAESVLLKIYIEEFITSFTNSIYNNTVQRTFLEVN